MAQGMKPEVMEAEVILHSTKPRVAEVVERLGTNLNLLSRAFVVREGGWVKLIVPGGTNDEEPLTALVLPESDLKSVRGLEAKLAKKAEEVGYEDGAVRTIAGVATKLMADSYRTGKKVAEGKEKFFLDAEGKMPTRGGLIEGAQMAVVRPFTVLTERGMQAAKDVSNEYWEGQVLRAMMDNDRTRLNYLVCQAAETLSTMSGLEVGADWKELYENTMALEFGPGNYPPINCRQGIEAFIQKVYLPVVGKLLSAAEIASTMGDHEAVKITAELKGQMEVMLAERKAKTAKVLEPIRAGTEIARIEADGQIAEVLGKNEDALTLAKRINAKLAAETIASPLLRGAGQLLEAGSEAAPAVFKGFAEYLNRWLNQKNADVKLVGTTSAGLAVGIVAGAAVAFVVTPIAGVVVLAAVPTAAAAGYMAWKGFTTED